MLYALSMFIAYTRSNSQCNDIVSYSFLGYGVPTRALHRVTSEHKLDPWCQVRGTAALRVPAKANCDSAQASTEHLSREARRALRRAVVLSVHLSYLSPHLWYLDPQHHPRGDGGAGWR